MTKEQLREEFISESKNHAIFIVSDDAFDWFYSKLEQEIAELKEDNLRLRNAQEVGGNMYGHKLNEVSALHKQVESLTERLNTAESLLDQAVKEWSMGDNYEFCENFKLAYSEYNSIKSKTK